VAVDAPQGSKYVVGRTQTENSRCAVGIKDFQNAFLSKVDPLSGQTACKRMRRNEVSP
jgi:hypothetical protein